MGIRVECDWCRQPIKAGTPYVTIEIDGKAGGRDVGGPARVFCGDGETSCAGRLLALLDANPEGPVDMGMAWQLVPVGTDGTGGRSGRSGRYAGNRTPAPVPVRRDAELDDFLGTLAPSCRNALSRALRRQDVSSLDQVAAMSDDDLLEIQGVGWKTRTVLRTFIAARGAAREKDPPPATDPLTLDSLELSERTLSILTEHGVTTLQELRRDLRSLPADKAMLGEIEAALDKAVAA
jgi:hypothetical protein